MLRTVDSSLLDLLLLTASLGSRSLLVTFAWGDGALLATGLLWRRCNDDTAVAIAIDLAASFLNLLEAISE